MVAETAGWRGARGSGGCRRRGAGAPPGAPEVHLLVVHWGTIVSGASTSWHGGAVGEKPGAGEGAGSGDCKHVHWLDRE